MTESLSLTPREFAALHDALDDEHLAWATYTQVLEDFGVVRPFSNIRDAEGRHIQALERLFARYGIDVPSNPWVGRVPHYDSLEEACAGGVEAELENEQLYERLMASTDRPDILRVFERLRAASRDRHLPAFRRCLSRDGAGGGERGPGGGPGRGPGRGRGRGRGPGRGRGQGRGCQQRAPRAEDPRR